MIARRYIGEWKEFAPWRDNAQVEQDLVEIFSDAMIRKNLGFRGGTASHKLFFKLYWGLNNNQIDTGKLLHWYRTYMEFSAGQPPRAKMFIANMDAKMKDKEFRCEIHVMLRLGIEYNNEKAYQLIKNELLEKI